MSRALIAVAVLIAVAHPWLIAAVFGVMVLASAGLTFALTRRIAREWRAVRVLHGAPWRAS